MKFRLRMLLLHLAASAFALTLVLGGLYLGWYHWPGWFLTVASPVAIVLICVDVVLGPMLTFIIANPAKVRRELARDLAVIVVVQLLALGYGTVQLWHGRPLYYAFSGGILQIVQAYDLDPDDAARARDSNPGLAPHWYSLPRWVYAPGPAASATPALPAGTPRPDDSVMANGYQPWQQGLAELRSKLQPVEKQGFFIFNERDSLKARMQAAGMHPEQSNSMPMSGRGRPVLVVFEPATMQIVAMLKPR